jgi:hypothetical protein
MKIPANRYPITDEIPSQYLSLSNCDVKIESCIRYNYFAKFGVYRQPFSAGCGSQETLLFTIEQNVVSSLPFDNPFIYEIIQSFKTTTNKIIFLVSIMSGIPTTTTEDVRIERGMRLIQFDLSGNLEYLLPIECPFQVFFYNNNIYGRYAPSSVSSSYNSIEIYRLNYSVINGWSWILDINDTTNTTQSGWNQQANFTKQANNTTDLCQICGCC